MTSKTMFTRDRNGAVQNRTGPASVYTQPFGTGPGARFYKRPEALSDLESYKKNLKP